MAFGYGIERLWTMRMPHSPGVGNTVDIGPQHFFLINGFSLYAWDESRLACICSIPHRSCLLSCVRCIGASVYLGTTDGDLYVFDCERLVLCSRHRLGCGTVSAIEDFGGHVGVGSFNGACIFMDERSNLSLSESDSQCERITSIAFNGEYFYCIGTANYLLTRDLRGGRTKSISKPLGLSGGRNSAKFNRLNRRILNYIDRNGSLCEFDCSGHRSRSVFRFTRQVTDIHTARDFVLSTDRSGELSFFNGRSYRKTFAIKGFHEDLAYSHISSDGSLLFTSGHLLKLSAINRRGDASESSATEPELRIR
jgi:hypothetical protein